MKIPPGFRAITEEHFRRLNKVTEYGGVLRIKKLYGEAQAGLEAKLAKAVKDKKSQFSVYQYNVLLAQLRQGQIQIIGQLTNALGTTSLKAQEEALNGLIKDITKLEKRYSGATITLPIEEASRFAGIIDRSRSSLLRMHKSSMARYGAGLVQKMEGGLAASMLQGETAYDAIDRVVEIADAEWWQAERVVRTEQSMAYNSTHADGILDASAELPDMMMRWSEHVDDESGEPLDDRVGKDSLAMHGQLARAGGLFTMPPDSRVSVKVWGRVWPHPPNRPNDRAVLLPWRPGWGIPGWMWSGRRVPMR